MSAICPQLIPSKAEKTFSILIILSISGGFLPENMLRTNAASDLNVVASISIVADFASQVGEGLFNVTSIVSGSENPHLYDPTPSEIQSVVNADLFIRLGLEDLEPWVDAIIDANPGISVLTLYNSSYPKFDPIIDKEIPQANDNHFLDYNVKFREYPFEEVYDILSESE